MTGYPCSFDLIRGMTTAQLKQEVENAKAILRLAETEERALIHLPADISKVSCYNRYITVLEEELSTPPKVRQIMEQMRAEKEQLGARYCGIGNLTNEIRRISVKIAWYERRESLPYCPYHSSLCATRENLKYAVLALTKVVHSVCNIQENIDELQKELLVELGLDNEGNRV